jgi:pimeloyl-ACP methyl ester carboxylesterase
MEAAQRIDGVDVYVQGSGMKAIVMVHGWPDTYRLWDEQVEHLKANYRCVRFTLPGFDCATPRRAHSLAALVDTLKRIVEQTCAGDQVTLLLHDWGCIFGYEFALRHPELVRRIIAVDVGDAGSTAHRRVMTFKAKTMVFAYQAWLAIAWRIGGDIGDRMARAMARWLRCPSDPRFIGAKMCYPYYIEWTGAHGGYPRRRVLELACPMLYIHGRRKPFQFQSAAWLEALRRRPGSLALEFDTGHWVMKSRPREFNEAVAAWLASNA